MQRELDEKQKKYAEMDAQAEDIELTAIDDDDEGGIKYSLRQINERFNQELDKQIKGELPDEHIYYLGYPSPILLSCGVDNLPIECKSSKLKAKATSSWHIFNLEHIRNLPFLINSPLAVFAYDKERNNINIILDVTNEVGKNFIVGIMIKSTYRGYNVNDIRTIFPKDNHEWLNWIVQGKLLYAQKEKIQAKIRQQRINAAEVQYLDLDKAASMVEELKNPDEVVNIPDNTELSSDNKKFSLRSQTNPSRTPPASSSASCRSPSRTPGRRGHHARSACCGCPGRG